MPVRVDAGPTLAITPSAAPASPSAGGSARFGAALSASPGAVTPAGSGSVASGNGGTGLTLAQMKTLAQAGTPGTPASAASSTDTAAADTAQKNVQQFFASFQLTIATKSTDGTGLDKE